MPAIPDPLGPSIEYMISHKVFDPIPTSALGLCHFYQVGQSREIPKFPEPHHPTMEKQLCCLCKDHSLVRLNLIITLPQDSVITIALLSKLHSSTSLSWLRMEGVNSLCPFCQYSGSNDQLFLNHIVGAHYCASFGCGKCLNVVYSSGQNLSRPADT